MDSSGTDGLVKAVAAGFDALQTEYQKLHGQHQALQRMLATAREQYNELAKLCNTSGAVSTPPLSLSSTAQPTEPTSPDRQTLAEVLDQSLDRQSKEAARKLREASQALDLLKHRPNTETHQESGVKIWSGRSADDRRSSGRHMPVVSESPLEQDFTIEGVPSKLGCPFAGMANKKLSSHAASVLSRYNHGSTTGPASSTPLSAQSRVNGRESFAKRSDQRPNLPDPIKAEICGLSDHEQEASHSETALKDHVEKQEAEAGVCPIRFLDQHSPEEVATYFENHKHELPRSHEFCVKRYQSNEEQIQELDAKYGNLVTMIQGLGAKHKDFLPKEPEDEIDQAEAEAKSAEKVRQWADNVSAQAMNGRDDSDTDSEEDVRQQHFERPLRDIRVGESPSRPWGISVPVKYLDRQNTQTSSLPAAANRDANNVPEAKPDVQSKGEKRGGKCPFDFGEQKKAPLEDAQPAQEKAAFISAERPVNVSGDASEKVEHMVFTGPVFIGYSAEDAAKILRSSGLKAT